MRTPVLNPGIKELLREGTVIPAHPLALNADRLLDESRQRALTRYYLDAGAGGVAVGVHTTQFGIRKPVHSLLEPVLRMAAEEIDGTRPGRPFIKVAGICGPPVQALQEAALAVKCGYDLGLLSLGGLNNYTEPELIRHARAVSGIIPVFGFYLQPAVGGRPLSYDFWKAFAEIPGVHAIKVAAFNRYQTLDVVRAVCCSSRNADISLYTGNDDNIVADLLTPFRFSVDGKVVEKRFAGGLLGHWAVWTRRAAELLTAVRECRDNHYEGSFDLLRKGAEITDMNAAVFDAPNAFRGCIPGIHEVLRRQGLLEGRWCLDPEEELSAGQMEEIERVMAWYPHLTE
ncbi:dihydrodipicolinate synthase/N-acetylneuraminate lyase [Anseongella ginsenosidimutans]|uniref:Dihydrodipicolinate synthase/N-acetylneuraminate lyase n=1 Tax=Anseongella ginsenosidimutans TaxID=496056 RepID=A0A4R3KQF9_9SPHI|nr:dihydrodipicolinate synthase family protein [Anseongella ginsenosidimutans]QEC52203.1 dihydrodipicolinate synthase family protein [Anseongella ginsenosidimutans]TCS86750.1 dihydrodipicolinate synthase/N-acetylneuraminate lyase [Anseongella ginsenosidimutans]